DRSLSRTGRGYFFDSYFFWQPSIATLSGTEVHAHEVVLRRGRKPSGADRRDGVEPVGDARHGARGYAGVARRPGVVAAAGRGARHGVCCGGGGGLALRRILDSLP